MAAGPWEIDRLDRPATAGARLGIAGREASREALEDLTDQTAAHRTLRVHK